MSGFNEEALVLFQCSTIQAQRGGGGVVWGRGKRRGSLGERVGAGNDFIPLRIGARV